MRTISPTTRFKKDLKREMKGIHKRSLIGHLNEALSFLSIDQTLPERFQDHALNGIWDEHRDCHIRPDLILIYRRPDPKTLQLVRLASHSELKF